MVDSFSYLYVLSKGKKVTEYIMCFETSFPYTVGYFYFSSFFFLSIISSFSFSEDILNCVFVHILIEACLVNVNPKICFLEIKCLLHVLKLAFSRLRLEITTIKLVFPRFKL